MAELIDKSELKKRLNITGDLREYHRIIDYPLLKEIIAELPTVTEAEDIPIIHGKAELELHDKVVRAKAIDEFAEKISLEISESIIWDMVITAHRNGNCSETSEEIVDYVIDTAKRVAEQLKGEQ